MIGPNVCVCVCVGYVLSAVAHHWRLQCCWPHMRINNENINSAGMQHVRVRVDGVDSRHGPAQSVGATSTSTTAAFKYVAIKSEMVDCVPFGKRRGVFNCKQSAYVDAAANAVAADDVGLTCQPKHRGGSRTPERSS